MKVSIITVVYNNARCIEHAIKSVLKQTYLDIEYIIIDGASSDGTINIINTYKDKIQKVISEPDRGIYDAMNKGIEFATGEVVGILNSDDFYSDDDVIADVVDCFQKFKCEAVYGDLCYVDSLDTSKMIRHWNAGDFKVSKFLYGWMPPHPSFFVKKNLYNQYGTFNTSFRFSADYELMLRFLFKYKISAAYLPRTLVKMRMGGVSNASILNRIKANKEDAMAWRVNSIKPYFFTRILKPLSKVKQFGKL